MKKLLFFILLGTIVCPGKVFAKAECVGYTQERCCSFKNTWTLSDAISYCGEGNYSDDGVYYAGCYKCIRCQKGYYLNGNGCLPCYSNVKIKSGKCLECSSSTVCTAIECSRGYYSTGTECKQCPAGSTAEAGATSCTLCPPGTYGVNGFCYSCQENHWSSEAGSTSCQWYYTIPVEHGKCNRCTKDGTCTQANCDSGYADNNGKCEELNCPPGETVSGNYCKACQSKTWSKGGNVNGCWTCSSIKIEKGTCTDCTVDGTCTEVSCNSGYTANGTKCEKTVTCSGRTPDAITQGDGSIKCSCTATSCGTGAKCAKHPAYNSKTKQNNYSVCVCQSGYYDDGESCSSCDDGCSTCSGPGACTVCKEGYSLSGGRCVPCPPNCATCDANGSCSQCSSGYLENNGACLKCEADVNLSGNNCVRYCNLAASGYSDTVGDVQNVCLWASCYTGNVWGTTKVYFAYSANSNRYVLDHYYCCPENCAECSDWGQCTTCNDGYTLQDGACVAGCDQYDVGNGTCTECDSSGCTDAECNGTNAYFDPTFRKCGVECDVNQYLDSSYTCQDCPAGQTSTGGWLTTPTNCYSCESIPVDGGTCTECQDGVCTKARCENGYVLDASGTACIAARATCSDPLKISDDGCCCVK